MSVYMQFTTLTTVGDRYVARARIKKLEPHEVVESDEEVDSYTYSREEAWAACEAALQMMASECLREAGECRARAKGVQRGVA